MDLRLKLGREGYLEYGEVESGKELEGFKNEKMCSHNPFSSAILHNDIHNDIRSNIRSNIWYAIWYTIWYMRYNIWYIIYCVIICNI